MTLDPALQAVLALCVHAQFVDGCEACSIRRREAYGYLAVMAERALGLIAPPPLVEGQARCPACRNAAAVLKSGALNRHRDLFDNACWNRRLAPTEIHLTEIPPVVINEHATAEKGKCRECGKWLPGERSLCGRCSVLRSA